MKKLLIILGLMFLASPLRAGQIDYVLRFANEAAGLTALQSFTNRDEWPTDYCIPGVQVWRNSQDVSVPDGQGGTAVTHTYFTGFIVLCSFPRVIPALRDLAQVQVVLDRDKALARQPGAVIKANVSNAILQDLRFSPIYAGSDFPWGAMQ